MTTEAPPAYEKLTRPAPGPLGGPWSSRCRLWLGPDHILSVHNSGYSESYKRFYFGDIQAITIVRTGLGTIRAWLLGIAAFAALLLLAASITTGWHVSSSVIWAVISASLLAALIAELAAGPTCVCYVRTAVQTERLYPLTRLRQAQNVIERLRGIIEQRQGSLSPDQAADAQAEAMADDMAESEAPAARPAPVNMRGKADRVLKPYRGNAHLFMFSLLGADLLYEAAHYLVAGDTLLITGIAVSLALAAATVVALIRQQGASLPLSIKSLSWVCLGYIFISYVIGSIYSTAYMIMHPELEGNSWKCARQIAAIYPPDSLPRMVISIFNMAGSGILGLTGLVLLAFRKTRANPSPPPLRPAKDPNES